MPLEKNKELSHYDRMKFQRVTQLGEVDNKGVSISVHEGTGVAQQRLPFLDSKTAHNVPVWIAQMAVGCIDLMGLVVVVCAI